MGGFRDLSGKTFGRLTVLSCAGRAKDHHVLWKCLCRCGNTTIVPSNSLLLGRTTSCGCYPIELIRSRGLNSATHHLRHTRLYTIWANMKQRCTNPNYPQFKDYGGRGISVCSEWANSFKRFYTWAMENGYQKHLTIDRIDNNGIYEPSNCRWVTMLVQNHNKRNSKKRM